MQRLIDHIWEELRLTSHDIEISVLDDKGDSSSVYNGELAELSAHHVANVLKDPSCVYFFLISAMAQTNLNGNLHRHGDGGLAVIRRDLAWLTDPLPPEVVDKSHNSFTAHWLPIKFCGISARTENRAR